MHIKVSTDATKVVSDHWRSHKSEIPLLGFLEGRLFGPRNLASAQGGDNS